jgi:hypothetical protein
MPLNRLNKKIVTLLNISLSKHGILRMKLNFTLEK